MEENKKVSGYPLFEGGSSDRNLESSHKMDDEHSTTGDGHPARVGSKKGSTTGDGHPDREHSTTGDGHPDRKSKSVVNKIADAVTGENH